VSVLIIGAKLLLESARAKGAGYELCDVWLVSIEAAGEDAAMMPPRS
jgi:hypothetical protein